MVMRFRGGGVGHTSVRKATDSFYQDRDALDKKSVRSQALEEEDVDEDVEDLNDEEHEDADGDLSETELEQYGYCSEEEEEEEAEEGEWVTDEEQDDNLADDVEELGFAAF